MTFTRRAFLALIPLAALAKLWPFRHKDPAYPDNAGPAMNVAPSLDVPDTLDVCVGIDRVTRTVTFERLDLRGCDYCGRKLAGCACKYKDRWNYRNTTGWACGWDGRRVRWLADPRGGMLIGEAPLGGVPSYIGLVNA